MFGLPPIRIIRPSGKGTDNCGRACTCAIALPLRLKISALTIPHIAKVTLPTRALATLPLLRQAVRQALGSVLSARLLMAKPTAFGAERNPLTLCR
jgi:hypothetical protein